MLAILDEMMVHSWFCDKTNWRRQRETQTIYTHGNGEQVETIRVGKTIRLAGKHKESGKLDLNCS